jgi:hypothetical protein
MPLEGTPYGDHLLHNINTPEDYHVLIRASAAEYDDRVLL